MPRKRVTVSVSALSVLALSGAASAADQRGPQVVEEHATASNDPHCSRSAGGTRK
jgi:hypothetical protein